MTVEAPFCIRSNTIILCDIQEFKCRYMRYVIMVSYGTIQQINTIENWTHYVCLFSYVSNVFGSAWQWLNRHVSIPSARLSTESNWNCWAWAEVAGEGGFTFVVRSLTQEQSCPVGFYQEALKDSIWHSIVAIHPHCSVSLPESIRDLPAQLGRCMTKTLIMSAVEE